MAKVQRGTLLDSFVSAEVYQWKQGKIIRRSTAAAIVLTCVLAAQALYGSALYGAGPTGRYLPMLPQVMRQVPVGYWIIGLLDLVGVWIAFRAINYPAFADFLIEVESEMAKVTWPTWAELQRATVVVLGTMFVFTALLFGYHIAWQNFLELTGVLRLKS